MEKELCSCDEKECCCTEGENTCEERDCCCEDVCSCDECDCDSCCEE